MTDPLNNKADIDTDELPVPRSSNDNAAGALADLGFAQSEGGDSAAQSLPLKSISFEGSASLYVPGVLASGIVIAGLIAGAVIYGAENFQSMALFRLLAFGGGGACGLLLLFAFLRRRTIGLHSAGPTIRVTPGFPNLNLYEVAARDVSDTRSRRGLIGRLSRSGTLSLQLNDGRRYHLRGLQNSEGAHAHISLQVAAAKAAEELQRFRIHRSRHWAEATMPRGLNELSQIAEADRDAAKGTSGIGAENLRRRG